VKVEGRGAQAGMCKTCWDRVRLYGQPQWSDNPVAVIENDVKAHGSSGRDILRSELAALAALAAQHEDEFRELLEAEAVMRALLGIGRTGHDRIRG
jgi:hypothetical protein